jgi:hypothetical protein
MSEQEADIWGGKKEKGKKRRGSRLTNKIYLWELIKRICC